MKSLCHARDALALLFVMFVLTGVAWAAPAGKRVSQTPSLPAIEQPSVAHFSTAVAALEQVLRIPARVVAVGEYHQTTATVAIRSSLSRFADEMVPALARSATDLVVETWISTGACGAQETKVEQQVETTTERPPETENEILTLLGRAKAAGLAPHILVMSCKDYRYVTDKQGNTDFARMLKLTRDRLLAEVVRWLHEPSGRPEKPARTVIIYGGALHNDLYPTAADRAYAFGQALYAKAKGEYLEIDLFVPEFIANDARLAKQSWFGLFKENAKAEDALLIRRSERSFVILFPPTKKVDRP